MASTFIENEGTSKPNSLGANLEQFFNFFGNWFDPLKQGMDGYAFFDLSPAQQACQDALFVVDI